VHLSERKLRRLFADQGFNVVKLRNNRHWVGTVERTNGGPAFTVVCSQTPSDRRFERQFITSLKRAEREANNRTLILRPATRSSG